MDLSGGEDIEENMLCEGSNSVDNILKTNDISTQNLPNSEKNLDDYANSSDSLSSSVSLSDSDLTSTDSEDSLALSESESITDVTPLNSPYCDSPLYQNKLPEHKLEDRNINPRNFDSGGMREGCSAPVVNVLMQAIAKLEIEAKKAEQPTVRVSPVRRRTVSYGGEDIKKVEQENHRLFKRLISQQNRVRTMHSSTGQPSQKSLSIKHQDLVKSDGDISVSPKSTSSSNYLKDGAKRSQHQQKCLSHPSDKFSFDPLTSKMMLKDDTSSIKDGVPLTGNVAGTTFPE